MKQISSNQNISLTPKVVKGAGIVVERMPCFVNRFCQNCRMLGSRPKTSQVAVYLGGEWKAERNLERGRPPIFLLPFLREECFLTLSKMLEEAAYPLVLNTPKLWSSQAPGTHGVGCEKAVNESW